MQITIPDHVNFVCTTVCLFIRLCGDFANKKLCCVLQNIELIYTHQRTYDVPDYLLTTHLFVFAILSSSMKRTISRYNKSLDSSDAAVEEYNAEVLCCAPFN